MAADPIEAGRRGGRSRSAKKLAAIRKNGFQKRYGVDLPSKQETPALPLEGADAQPESRQQAK
jgi:hypothetical protein